MLAHIQFLMDNGNAGLLRTLRRQVPVFTAKNPHRAAVPRVNTAQDLHQRRFSGSVFTQQRHHFAGSEFKPNIIKRPHSGKCLDNVLHGYQNLAHSLSPPFYPDRSSSIPFGICAKKVDELWIRGDFLLIFQFVCCLSFILLSLLPYFKANIALYIRHYCHLQVSCQCTLIQ